MCSGPERSNSNSSLDDMNERGIQSDDHSSSLLELAANNDLDSFRQCIESDSSAIDLVGLWLVRKKGAKQVVNEERTPLMVAATYGSIDVLKLILSWPEVDVNRTCGTDKCTALHCASFGGSVNAAEAVRLLISAGADPNIADGNGLRAADVISLHPKLPGGRLSIEELFTINVSESLVAGSDSGVSNVSSPVLSSSPETGSPSYMRESKKEYPIDPSLPDIKNGIYSSDEFRMFSFKVRPCSRAYSHDWTECPFVHPGENARRRDPRKYHYSCVPCPEFRKGACRRGDMCEYAHGVFECWLHPAQYRTRLCKDGIGCARRVCFFAHTPEELRPLYVSTGSAVPSPRSVAATASIMDMAAALNLLPGSPTAGSIPHSPPVSWSPHQPNVPTLHLPGSNLQSSRLRSSFNARETFDSNLGCFSPSLNRPKTLLTQSNLEDLFSAELNSPSHKAAVFNQFQQQQRMLSPINTTTTSVFSPKNSEHHSLLKSPFAVSSPGRMSPRSGIDPLSPMSGRRGSQTGKSWSNLGSSIDTNIDWSLNGDHKPWHAGSCVENGKAGPDLSWVQSLVKESPHELNAKPLLPTQVLGSGAPPPGEGLKSTGSQIDSIDYSVLGAWLEQMQLEQQLVA